MPLPPGPVYLLSRIPRFAIPSAIVYLSIRVAHQQTSLKLPSWVVFVASLLARPVIFYVHGLYADIINKREAAKHGATLPPLVQESGLKVIQTMVENLKHGYPAEPFRRWAEGYGHTYRIHLLTETALFTDDPDAIKAMLATQFEAFEKGPIFQDQIDALLGTGVFNSDGEMWKFHRGITRPFFTRERISDFDIYARNADRSLKQAKKRLAEGYSIDFQDLVSRFTLDSATEFLFGHNVSSLSAGLPYPPSAAHLTPASYHTHPATVFTKAFSEGQLLASLRTGQGTEWRLFEFWKDKVTPLRKVMDAFTEPVIKEALEKEEREKEVKDEEEGTLLEYLVKQTQDPKILKDELVNLLVAGRDTTMGLITYSVYMLIQNPHIEPRLRQEIFDTVGPTARPTYDHMRKMRFVRAFLNEVLRLYPSVPVNVRKSNRAVLLPNSEPGQKPFYIPADTTCIYGVLNTHRRADLWGPDAQMFDPDRFLDERVHKYLTPNPFIFCPFNAGPRICLGQQFAYHEATFYLVKLLQHFTGFTLDEETNQPPLPEWASATDRKKGEEVHPITHLTLSVVGGFWIRMKQLNPGALD
ncbi:unnamed protein product [Cyclocybe aegerita]|uniref:Cytochrome P450 monooxygenase pc-3 n=1 Tax=Cyclocybe aegerita TaxID=1973307 RepID=A0A8S0VR47_CYCAE|nr:unnamed protein product [Cyclocybe aegerita]